MGRQRRRRQRITVVTTADSAPPACEASASSTRERGRNGTRGAIKKRRRPTTNAKRTRPAEEGGETGKCTAIAAQFDHARSVSSSESTGKLASLFGEPPPSAVPGPPAAGDGERDVCLWCYHLAEDDADGRCLTCQAKYGGAQRDTSLGDTHTIFVGARLPTTTPEEVATANWRLQQLEAAAEQDSSLTVKAPAASWGAVALEVAFGPFILGRSGAQGQALHAFQDAVGRVNSVLQDLLHCFSYLTATPASQGPSGICGSEQLLSQREVGVLVRGVLEFALGRLSADKPARLCVHDSLRNLEVMMEELLVCRPTMTPTYLSHFE